MFVHQVSFFCWRGSTCIDHTRRLLFAQGSQGDLLWGVAAIGCFLTVALPVDKTSANRRRPAASFVDQDPPVQHAACTFLGASEPASITIRLAPKAGSDVCLSGLVQCRQALSLTVSGHLLRARPSSSSSSRAMTVARRPPT